MTEHALIMCRETGRHSTLDKGHEEGARSSVDGHLGCFHVPAIVSSAAVNFGVHVSFLSYGFLRVYAQWWACWVIW